MNESMLNSLMLLFAIIAEGLLITPGEYDNCSAFIGDKFYQVPNIDRLLIVSDDPEFMEGELTSLLSISTF